MKRAIFCLVPLFLLLAFAQPVKANHAARGELVYEWVSDSTYRFFLKFYRDCTGDAESTTQPLCFTNTCNSNGFTVNMTKFSPTGTASVTNCSKYKTKCDSPLSIYSGNIEWIYSAVVTLPSKCSLWKMFSYTNYRNNSDNLPNSSTSGFYIEASLNNLVAQGNSSPFFASHSLNYICPNQPISYNYNALDPNNDSLRYELITPLTGVTNCSGTPIDATTFGGYSLPDNPLPCGKSFIIDSATGQIIFTPTQLGIFTITVRVKEYRNGILIGSVMKDMQLQVAPCVYLAPQTQFAIDANTVSGCSYSSSASTGTSTIYACVNKPFSFCYYLKSFDTNTIFILSDNHLMSANISYTNQGTDSVRGCFSWIPSINDTGLGGFIIVVKDSSCRPVGPMIYYPLIVNLNVMAGIKAMPDDGVCPNGSIILSAKDDINCTWAILPGGSPNSLSCYNCSNPIASPTILTQYEVTGTTCGFKDTVSIGILPNTYPSISITANPGTNVWPYLNVTFTALSQNCNNPVYQWKVNGVPIAGAVSNTWNTTDLSDMDEVSCELTCKDICPLPADTISNKLNMHIPASVNQPIKNKDELIVYPNPNKGDFSLKILTSSNRGRVEILNCLGELIYKNEYLNGSKKINLDTTQEGIYFLRLITDEGVKTTQFCVKR